MEEAICSEKEGGDERLGKFGGWISKVKVGERRGRRQRILGGITRIQPY